MNAREKARHAQRLLDDPLLKEVMGEAQIELIDHMIHGEEEDARQNARMRLLGIHEIKSQLKYLTSELFMQLEGDEEEEDADTE